MIPHHSPQHGLRKISSPAKSHATLLAFYSGCHWRIMPANALGTAYSPFSSARLQFPDTALRRTARGCAAKPADLPDAMGEHMAGALVAPATAHKGQWHATRRPVPVEAMAVPSKARGCHSPASSPLDGRRCKSTPCVSGDQRGRDRDQRFFRLSRFDRQLSWAWPAALLLH